MEQIEIKTAKLQDAQSILEIKKEAWPDEPVRLKNIQLVLENPEHETLIAVLNDAPVGIVDAFPTRKNSVTRWEVDLLAVKPAARRKGIAAKLVNQVTKKGSQTGASFARALIQVENTASQRSFSKIGFQRDQACRLYIRDRQEAETIAIENDILIPVHTINYQGYWLEDDFSIETIQKSITLLNNSANDMLGMLVPEHELQPEKLSAAGLVEIDNYEWWIYPYKN